MNSTKATAHQAGVLYFLFMIVAIFGEFFSPAFIVPGDAAATVAVALANMLHKFAPLVAVFATGVGVAVVLIASHSRPFTGEISVSPSVLQQVMLEAE